MAVGKSRSKERLGVFVALLRGINVGGRMVPMNSLVEAFVEAGCRDVQTYIQSGNVVFRATEAAGRRVASRVQEALAARFRFDVPVVVRTAVDLRAVAKNNPFARVSADDKALHVAFLADRPSAARVAALDPERSPPDRFSVRGREIYLHCPGGIGRSKLTNDYFDTKLGTTSTMRNWRTVQKLVELSAG